METWHLAKTTSVLAKLLAATLGVARATGALLVLFLTLAGSYPARAEVADGKCQISVSRGMQGPFPLGTFTVKGRFYQEPKWYQFHDIGEGFRARDRAGQGIRRCVNDALNSRGIPASCTQRQIYGKSKTGQDIWSEIHGWTVADLKATALRRACQGSESSGAPVTLMLDKVPGEICLGQLWIIWKGTCPSARPVPPPLNLPRSARPVPPPLNLPPGSRPAPPRNLPVACYNGRVVNGQCVCGWGFRRELIGPNAYNCVRRGR